MKKQLLAMSLVLLLLVLCIPSVAGANAAEPPALVLMAEAPPKDLEVTFLVNGNRYAAEETRRAWEHTYAMYYYPLREDGWEWGKPLRVEVEITAGGEVFTHAFEGAELAGYHNTFAIDIRQKTIRPVKSFWRGALLVLLRVMLTLVIEGAVFFLLGFREKRSWKCFLFTNLLTQGALNGILCANLSLYNSAYGIFLLVPLELVIIVVESIVFARVVQEHATPRRIAYAVVANIASWALGGWMLAALPI